LEIYHPGLHTTYDRRPGLYISEKYLLGGLLFMIFIAFQISANHLQMTYYFLFVMLFIVIAFLVEAIRKNQLPDFLKSTAVLFFAGIIGVAANASNLYHTYEYSKESMRGKSELTHHGKENKTDDGLERDYITAWSYGIGETWTLLIPNAKGGASVPISDNEKAKRSRCGQSMPHSRRMVLSSTWWWWTRT